VTLRLRQHERKCGANVGQTVWVCLVSSKAVFKESKANWTALPYIVGGAFLKLHLWLIKFIGVIVPRRLRADWRQEWEAELRYREALLSEWDNLNWKTKLDLLRRSLGAFRDALLLQPRRLEDEMFQDLSYGARMLAKSPGFTAVAALSLALGIGANTAIFSLMDAVLLRMLPVRQPEQLVLVNTAQTTGLENQYSYPVYEQFRDQQRSFAGIFASSFVDRWNIKTPTPGANGEPESVEGALVSGSYFSVLGVKPAMGRVFTMEDDRAPGGHPVAVISHRYWQRRWAGDPAAIGRTFTLNDTAFTIIGVAPPEFFGVSVGQAPDLWVPTMMKPQVYPGRNGLTDRGYTWAQIFGRLKPDVGLQQSQADLNLVFQRMQSQEDISQLSPQRQQEFRSQRIELTPAGKGLSELRRRFSQPLGILMAVVALVLLIACANVANLLLTRAAARRKEIAVRLALGASRLRLIRQLLTESALLAFLGGALGLLFAYWSGGVLLALASTGTSPIPLDISPNPRILAFTIAVSMFTGILFGLAPALRATRVDLTPALKDTAPGSGGNAARYSFITGGRLLIVTQVTLSLLLLVGAGLFIRTLRNLKNQDAGFNREQVLIARIDAGGHKGEQLTDLYRKLFERINALPGARSASFAFQVFRGGESGICCIAIQGAPPLPEADRRVNAGYVAPKFFETMGTPLLQGRDFNLGDNENAQPVAVINEAAARHYFPDESPIGKRFLWLKKEIEIVGVVKDAKHYGLREQAPRMFYLPLFQRGRPNFLAARVAGDPMGKGAGIIAALRDEARAVDPKLSLLEITTLSAQVDASLVQERLIATLSGFFGLLALSLSSVGLYGVMSYTVSRRTAEIGIRMALGASAGRVMRMVLRETLLWVALGVALGLGAALATTRWVESLLFGLKPNDPLTIGLAATVLLAVAAVAAYLPARRASRVDPMAALREE